MADKKLTKLAYCGRRLGDRALLLDQFKRLHNLDGSSLTYKAATRFHFAIGSIYEGELSEDLSLSFGTLKDTGETVDRDLRAEWSALDAAARRAKLNESARKKLIAERRDYWKQKLEPLRIQYGQMTAPQKRAMRQLIVEWLES